MYVTNYGREYTINIPQIWYKTVAIPAQFQLGAFIIWKLGGNVPKFMFFGKLPFGGQK